MEKIEFIEPERVVKKKRKRRKLDNVKNAEVYLKLLQFVKKIQKEQGGILKTHKWGISLRGKYGTINYYVNDYEVVNGELRRK